MKSPDANDVFREHGPDELRKQVDGAATVRSGNSGSKKPTFDWRQSTVSAKELQTMTFNPVTFLLPGLIPSEGITLVCSKPKVGKSWLLLDLCISATANRYVLGDLQVMQGDVLLLALEDSNRRLQLRTTKYLPTFTGEWPSGLTMATQWRRVDQGGLDDIRDWVETVRKAGRKVAFVAIDVLKMIRPPNRRGISPYDCDYDAIMGLHNLAIELGIAIIIAHHTRKAEAEDLIDKVSGTFGLVGAADTIIVIERRSQGTVFDVRGRDVESDELAVQFSKETARWTILGNAAEVHQSETKAKILDAICYNSEPVTPKFVTDHTGLSHSTVRGTMRRMVLDGTIRDCGGGKYVAGSSPHISSVTP
jgi:hypothetical protein